MNNFNIKNKSNNNNNKKKRNHHKSVKITMSQTINLSLHAFQ